MTWLTLFRTDIARYKALKPQTNTVYLLLTTQGLWAIGQYRFNHWVHTRVTIPGVRHVLRAFGTIWYKLSQILTGIDLPKETRIGKGLYIGHFGGIIINRRTVMGDYATLNQGVTIGISGRGEKRGCPVLGDRVFMGSGAKILGKSTIGNNVAIGANAVVTKDLPDNAVAGGIPAKVLNLNGASDYIVL